MPYSRRLIDGVCQRGRRRIDDDLTDGFCAERSGRLVAALKFYPQATHIQSGRDLVLHQRVFEDRTAVCICHIFIQCHADALSDTALSLGREQKREQQQECRRLPDWQEGDHWLLFLTADQPLVEKETIQKILAKAEKVSGSEVDTESVKIIRARCAGKEGSPVLFHASLIPELQQLSGDEGGRSVIRAHRDEIAFVDAADERQMTDVDTVEDLEKLEQSEECL